MFIIIIDMILSISLKLKKNNKKEKPTNYNRAKMTMSIFAFHKVLAVLVLEAVKGV